MSGLASLFNVPGSQNELTTWAFAHSSDHRDIIKAIQKQYGTNLPEYVLDPPPLGDLSTWIYQHQQMHNDMNAIIGASGFNLSNVDWKNTESRSGWIFSNATEHARASAILRLGPNTLPEIDILITSRSSNSAQSSSLQQVFTFNGQAIGPASADRYVIVCVGAVANSGGGIANVTVNGTAATQLATVNNAVFTSSGIYIIFVPTGTTANIVVTKALASLNTGCFINVYSITGITAPAASNVSTSSGVVSPSATFSVNRGGAIIGVAINRALSFVPTATWSGITKNAEVSFIFSGSAVFSDATAASKNFNAFSTVNSVCSFPGALAQAAGCFASFSP